ncbi:MAG: phosphate ABC transporter permease PstA [Solirubrobacteraceae bacterium]
MRNKYIQETVFWIFRISTLLVLGILAAILIHIFQNGLEVISWEFLTTPPTDGMTGGGIFPAIVGTFYLIVGSLFFAIPIGVCAGIYMNEYAENGISKKIITLMTDNLAGIPSIVFGLFGMALFVNFFKFGDSILAGSLTLSLMVLPIIIRTTEESLKSIDDTFRFSSYALGASKLVTIKKVLLPIAFPNILTGIVLSVGRVSGETAPILFTVAAYFLPELPKSIFDQVMALPYHLYVLATSGTEIEKSRPIAYATAVVLITIVLFTNLLANIIRRRYTKRAN